jgi:mannose-1-phosphate guanylyltransferase
MYAVIMAGGKGTRFWPKSREKMPKHLLDIACDDTIIQETVKRIELLIPPENILIVTGQSHCDELMGQLPRIPRENILVEPVGRNTAPCIGLAALHVLHRSFDDVMVVLPADHLIADAVRFRQVLSVAAEMAWKEDHLLTVGITPTAPETGYGYLEKGALKEIVSGEYIYEVKSVREKPPRTQAESFIAQGTFYWNSGMFIWKAGAVLRAIRQWLPHLYEGLGEIKKALGTDREEAVIHQVYHGIKPVSIDYGVMEKAGNVLLIPGDFGWSDVGSWDALWEVMDKDERGNAANAKELFLSVDSRNSLVHSPRKLVALVGVEDLIVVETDDALLVCRKGRSQDVKKVVEMLEEKNMRDLL